MKLKQTISLDGRSLKLHGRLTNTISMYVVSDYPVSKGSPDYYLAERNDDDELIILGSMTAEELGDGLLGIKLYDEGVTPISPSTSVGITTPISSLKDDISQLALGISKDSASQPDDDDADTELMTDGMSMPMADGMSMADGTDDDTANETPTSMVKITTTARGCECVHLDDGKKLGHSSIVGGEMELYRTLLSMNKRAPISHCVYDGVVMNFNSTVKDGRKRYTGDITDRGIEIYTIAK